MRRNLPVAIKTDTGLEPNPIFIRKESDLESREDSQNSLEESALGYRYLLTPVGCVLDANLVSVGAEAGFNLKAIVVSVPDCRTAFDGLKNSMI